MSDRTPLYYKALLAWRQELVKQRDEAFADRETPLKEVLRQRLRGMFGAEHVVKVEDRDDAPHDVVLLAEVEGLRFIGFRRRDGSVHIVLIEKCARCGHEMASDPFTSLAELGRDLTQFGMSGLIGEHECE